MTAGSIPLTGQLRDRPWVALIRDPAFYTTAMYMEPALMKLCNLVTIPFNILYMLSYGPGSGLFGPIVSGAVRRSKIRIPINLARWVSPLSVEDIDLILVVDPVRDAFTFRGFKGLTAYYAIDGYNPLCFESHIRDTRVNEYDHVFVATKTDVKKYKERGCRRVHWLPLACDPEIHKRYNVPLKYDLCFLGSVEWQGPRKAWTGIDYDARKRIIMRLKKEFNFYVGHRHWLHDLAMKYSESKMVFNKSPHGCLNIRVIETLGCGRLLVTDRVEDNGLEDLFINRKELVLYDDYKDLVEIIRYYLKNDEEREEIAMRGQRKAYAQHTYLHRATQILTTVLGRSFGDFEILMRHKGSNIRQFYKNTMSPRMRMQLKFR